MTLAHVNHFNLTIFSCWVKLLSSSSLISSFVLPFLFFTLSPHSLTNRLPFYVTIHVFQNILILLTDHHINSTTNNCEMRRLHFYGCFKTSFPFLLNLTIGQHTCCFCVNVALITYLLQKCKTFITGISCVCGRRGLRVIMEPVDKNLSVYTCMIDIL